MSNTLGLIEQRYAGRVSNHSVKIESPSRAIVRFDVLDQNGRAQHFVKRLSELLGEGDKNAKLAKNDKSGEFQTFGLSLSPADEAGLRNMCPFAHACKAACLNHSGRALMFETIHIGRIARTTAWQLAPEWFKTRLSHEISRHAESADKQGKRLCVRLNMYSDEMWEKRFPELFERFPNVQFYDYTKNPRRVGVIRPNYWTTFSRDETNEATAIEHITAGRNASIVFNRIVPSEYRGLPVVSGDETDLRFEDPRGVWIGLTFKGTNADKARALESGFCVNAV